MSGSNVVWGMDEDVPRELNMCLRSCSPTSPSPSWSINENASRNCWICGGENSENTPDGSRRARDFWAFVSFVGVLVGVMSGERPYGYRDMTTRVADVWTSGGDEERLKHTLGDWFSWRRRTRTVRFKRDLCPRMEGVVVHTVRS